MLRLGRIAVGACALILLTACGGSGEGLGGQDPKGYMYVTSAMDQSPGAVHEYMIGADGSATALSTGSVSAGSQPVAIVSDPMGHYVYVINQGDASISQFALGAGGTLTALATPVSLPAQTGPVQTFAASVDPSGNFLYVVGVSFYANSSVKAPLAEATISQFSIGTGGVLHPLSPASIVVPTFAAGPLAIDPGGRYAYLPGSGIRQFSISADGTLVSVATLAVAPNATGIAFTPDGRTAYVISGCLDTDCHGQATGYTVGAQGALTKNGSTTTTGGHVIPLALVTDTSGSSAYLLVNLMGVDTNQGAIYQYAINSAGALIPASPESRSTTSGAVAESVFGPSLYALSSNVVGFASGQPTGGHIDHYTIGTGGVLIAASTVTVNAGYPTAMTVVAAH
jgi:DNA-binding beta-propeller fold protein YncE